MKFTILAPGQAAPRAAARRRDVGRGRRSGSIPAAPTSGAARAVSSLALFFYDAPISRAIAFEGLLQSGERLVARLRGGLLATRAAGRSSCTAPPTASPTATTAASARWRWPRRSARSRPTATLEAHQLRRVPGRAPARPTRRRSARAPPGVRPRRRALAVGLRLPLPAGDCAPALAGAAARGARLAPRPDRRRSTRPGPRRLPEGPVGGARRLRAPSCSTASPAAARGVPRQPRARARSTRTRARRGAPPARAAAQPAAHVHLVRLVLRRDLGLEPVQILRYAAMAMQYLRDLGGRPTSSRSSSAGWRRRRATCPTSPTAARSTAGW